MESTYFTRRFIGAVIDFLILILVFSILGFSVLLQSFGNSIDVQEASYVLLNMIFFPLDALFKMFLEFDYYDIKYYITFIALFLSEVIYYSTMEILTRKGTVGYICTKIRIYSEDNGHISTAQIIKRNIFKTISRYLFALPFLTAMIMGKNQTIYDSKTKIMVGLNKDQEINKKRKTVDVLAIILLLVFIIIIFFIVAGSGKQKF